MNLHRFAAMVCAVMVLLAGVPASAASGLAVRLKAYGSILPQAYLIQRIGGDQVEVGVLVGEAQDPHTFEPAPKQMSALARSDVYFTIGVPFEKALVPKIKRLFPSLRLTDTIHGVKLRHFTHEDAGHGHGHPGQEPDPHTWLDPGRAKIMAGNIAASLKDLDPLHEEVFEDNLRAFREDLDRLDARIERILEPMRGARIYVFHPAFGYFCEAYGIEQRAFEVGGREPGTRELARIIESAKREGVRTIFVQPQFSMKAARVLAQAIGGSVVTLDPMTEDYIEDLEAMAIKIRQTYQAEPGRETGGGR